jgi:cytoplasmic iron level regulating protein YaaA (DUF328/UPF0246 family)
VRILLPPSEAKAPGGDGPPVPAAGLGDGPLAVPRAEVLAALARFCRESPDAAVVALGLPTSRAGAELAANAAVLDAPTMPTLDRFVGVLYDALAVATLSPAERAVAEAAILVSNGAFGLLGAAEPVPDHRVGMAAALPGLDGRDTPTVLGTFWRARLAPVLGSLLAGGPAPDGGQHLVVDLRSSDYVTVPPLTGPWRASTVPVRALTEKLVDGRWVRRPLSYQAKLAKGRLSRALLAAEAAGRAVKTVEDVAEVAEAAGFTALPGGRAGAPALDLVSRWEPATS